MVGSAVRWKPKHALTWPHEYKQRHAVFTILMESLKLTVLLSHSCMGEDGRTGASIHGDEEDEDLLYNK